jgi:hypothetical protein
VTGEISTLWTCFGGLFGLQPPDGSDIIHKVSMDISPADARQKTVSAEQASAETKK